MYKCGVISVPELRVECVPSQWETGLCHERALML